MAGQYPAGVGIPHRSAPLIKREENEMLTVEQRGDVLAKAAAERQPAPKMTEDELREAMLRSVPAAARSGRRWAVKKKFKPTEKAREILSQLLSENLTVAQIHAATPQNCRRSIAAILNQGLERGVVHKLTESTKIKGAIWASRDTLAKYLDL